MEKEVDILKEQIYFEELIFHISNEENQIKAKNIICKFNKKWVQSLLFNASDLFQLKIIGDLFSLTGKCEVELIENDSLTEYLFLRNLLGDKDKNKINLSTLRSINEYENPIQENTLLYIIKNDNVSSFVDFITSNNINIEEELITIHGYYKYHIIDICAHLGSVNIFKYLILNNAKFYPDTIFDSILGGNETLIEYIKSLGHSFEECLSFAIWRHHNTLAKWLIENYHCTDCTLAECAFGFNTEMLIYFIDTLHININSTDTSNKTALHWAVEHNDLNTVQYLISKGININLKDSSDKTAIDYATSEEMKNLFKNIT